MLDRGDALVSNADIEAARVPYEQAAAAGNAEAAVRLGATYDPAFLAQAGLRNVRGDVMTAQYWYRRAGGLESNPPQLSSVYQGTAAARVSEPVSTGPVIQRDTETGGTGQGGIQMADPVPTRLMQNSRSQTGRRRPVRERRTGIQPSAKGCPQSGNCLTPPR